MAYFKNKNPADKGKLDNRGILGYVIGYGTDSLYYKVWDFKSRSPIWVRNIRILENNFLDSIIKIDKENLSTYTT